MNEKTHNNANSLGHISAALRLWRMPQALRRGNVPVICGVMGNQFIRKSEEE